MFFTIHRPTVSTYIKLLQTRKVADFWRQTGDFVVTQSKSFYIVQPKKWLQKQESNPSNTSNGAR